MISYFSFVFLALALLYQAPAKPEQTERFRREAAEAAQKHHQEAVRLNDLAGNIRSESDAEALVDSIAKLFADQLPPPWATHGARHRLARVEYRSAIDPTQAIPEDRIVAIWNDYAREISAPDEAIITASELHSLHDLQYATAKLYWSQGWNQTIWTMPNIYTIGPDAQLAHSCRALEALHLFYDLDNRVENLRAARKELEQGKTFSADFIRLQERRPTFKLEAPRVELKAGVRENPVRTAELRYIREHGSEAMNALLKRLMDEFLPN
ncbi:MAG: hypothetical protein ACJ71Q_06950 [Terriglobales bacterium]